MAEQFDDYGASVYLEQWLSQFPLAGTELVFRWDNIDLMATGDVQRWLEVEPDTWGGQGRPILTQDMSLGEERLEFYLTEEAFNRTDSQLRFIVDQSELHSQLPAAMETHPIELRYIEVEFEPRNIVLDEDSTDPVDFTVVVRNSTFHAAHSPHIDPLTLEPAIGSIRYLTSVTGDGIGRFFYEYTPPADPDDLPPGTIVTVSTHALSRGGVRGYNSPPERRGAMHIARKRPVTNLRVEPRAACVENGKSVQLSVLDSGTGTPVTEEVYWQVLSGAGQMSSAGRYTAPGSGSGWGGQGGSQHNQRWCYCPCGLR